MFSLNPRIALLLAVLPLSFMIRWVPSAHATVHGLEWGESFTVHMGDNLTFSVTVESPFYTHQFTYHQLNVKPSEGHKLFGVAGKAENTGGVNGSLNLGNFTLTTVSDENIPNTYTPWPLQVERQQTGNFEILWEVPTNATPKQVSWLHMDNQWFVTLDYMTIPWRNATSTPTTPEPAETITTSTIPTMSSPFPTLESQQTEGTPWITVIIVLIVVVAVATLLYVRKTSTTSPSRSTVTTMLPSTKPVEPSLEDWYEEFKRKE